MTSQRTLLDLLALMSNHHDDSRLLGNMRAADIADAIIGILNERNELLAKVATMRLTQQWKDESDDD